MKEMIIASLYIIAGFPALVAIMSFVTWSNAFRMLGTGYIARMTAAILIMAWVIYFIPGGAR
ncbi:hypothetical protein V5080_03765 [Atlantibacter hermannii]|uniref:hypothetical protein n=1 Tax=Atlantibacter hermannii TaxID=565 RepID=UPI00289CE232|nr:hypothetical protein [Atlantibacter hermannii]